MSSIYVSPSSESESVKAQAPGASGSGFGKFIAGVVGLGLLGGVIWMGMEPRPSEEEQVDVKLFEVTRGSMTISETEAGVLRSTNVEVLVCDVWGSTTVISIVEEGSKVKAGDLLIELDSSGYEDYEISMEIEVEEERAELVQAQQNLKILEQAAISEVMEAEVRLKLAGLDLAKFKSDGGEYEQDVQRLQADITIAENDLTTAKDQYDWSRKLAAEGFVTDLDLNRDKLSEVRAELRLESAEDSLELLERYYRDRAIEKLTSDVDQSEFRVEKEKHRTQSNLVNAKARLFAQEAEYQRELAKLERVREHIANCKIYAPVDGMVVYATSVGGGMFGKSHYGREPLGEGAKVYQRQPLIRLPDLNGGMTVDVKLHESVVEKVTEGMPVRITTEALPGRTFMGELTRIAPLPNAASIFINPNLKVYNSEITITGDITGLRPGMSCQAEMLIDYHDDAVFVPVQSVLRQGDRRVVYLWENNQAVEREVRTGQDNNRMIHVVSGLEGGEQVMMAPPQPTSLQIGSSGIGFNQDAIDEAKRAAEAAASKPKSEMKKPGGKGGAGDGAKRPGGLEGGPREGGKGGGKAKGGGFGGFGGDS
jgi:HlyD family secretion protein